MKERHMHDLIRDKLLNIIIMLDILEDSSPSEKWGTFMDLRINIQSCIHINDILSSIGFDLSNPDGSSKIPYLAEMFYSRLFNSMNDLFNLESDLSEYKKDVSKSLSLSTFKSMKEVSDLMRDVDAQLGYLETPKILEAS